MNKNAVLLVNLGTPKSPTYKDLRFYLNQFLSDRRVVNKCPYFWKPLLKCVLLQIIPQRSAKNYAKIWNYELNESPLLTFTKQQVSKLQKVVDENTIVDFAFTYDAGRSELSIKNKLQELTKNGIENITVLPLYPQYSVSTTASIYDQVGQAFKKMQYIPAIKIIDSYYKNELYITALYNSIKQNVKANTTDLICSFHGVPVKYIEKGDVYQKHCEETFALLTDRLKAEGSELNLHLTYQSQFGRDEWLGPKTDFTVEKLAKSGVKNLAVITPGFAVDCIETLEEIAMEAKEDFIKAGGEEFTFIPCLNASDDAIVLFKDLV